MLSPVLCLDEAHDPLELTRSLMLPLPETTRRVDGWGRQQAPLPLLLRPASVLAATGVAALGWLRSLLILFWLLLLLLLPPPLLVVPQPFTSGAEMLRTLRVLLALSARARLLLLPELRRRAAAEPELMP